MRMETGLVVTDLFLTVLKILLSGFLFGLITGVLVSLQIDFKKTVEGWKPVLEEVLERYG